MAAMSTRWTPSVTVAAIVASDDGPGGVRRFLLVEEETPEGLRLNNPAGHLEPGETPQQAVVREALEETACAFVPDRLVGIYLARFVRPKTAEDVTYLRFAFGGTAGAPDPTRALDAPVVRTLWLTLDELHATRDRHRSELVLASVLDFAAGRRLPLDTITASPTLWQPRVAGPAG